MSARHFYLSSLRARSAARLLRLAAGLALASLASAQTPPPAGKIAGTIVHATQSQPVEFATVTVKKAATGEVLRTGATDAKGRFDFEGLPAGDYQVSYGVVGAEQTATASFAIDPAHRSVDLGVLKLSAGDAVKMEQFEVGARKEAFYNSIDRKVYNVGQDIQSATGSAGDLLKNVPSVQVDIEGNVSLRGDSNVLILIDGKTSTMMGRNRAAVLDQMPADGIEKIEVITNPSAKYKPDGTAGIINLTLKKKREPGYSGSLRSSVGNDGRSNAALNGNFNPGKYNLYGSVSVRQDDRPRTVQDDRSHLDAATNSTVATSQRTTEDMRPLSRIAQAGVDYSLDDHTKVGVHSNYNYRDMVRTATVTNLSRNAAGATTSDYDRVRRDPEFEEDLEFTATFSHAFPEENRELSAEVRRGRTTEQENNHYANVYRLPALATTFDNTLIKAVETDTEVSIDYAHPIDEHSKLELGYAGEEEKSDLDFRGSFLDPGANTWRIDPTRTNRFIYDSTIHALFSTYAHKLGKFGFLAGARFEHATIDTRQVTAGLTDRNSYGRLYPSLHLSYDLTETQQLQLNYSHRVHRPDADDLNPFPEYQDPFNLRAGNPRLVPEDIHSLESGWQYQNGDTTYLATAYYRQRYHGMTEVARYINATTLLTTKENLGTSRSGGLEFGATTRWLDRVGLNWSGNVYRNEIDASRLGFSARRSTIAWDSKLNANWDVSKNTLVQLNANYTAKRLTAQGYRYPTYVANLGLRHNFKDKKTALIVSASDIFNTLKERTHIDTPQLQQETVRRRSSRILYVGFIYNFGKAQKKQKDDLQFDTAL